MMFVYAYVFHLHEGDDERVKEGLQELADVLLGLLVH